MDGFLKSNENACLIVMGLTVTQPGRILSPVRLPFRHTGCVGTGSIGGLRAGANRFADFAGMTVAGKRSKTPNATAR
jgi:hypothetical protein